jgi:hypothetical protein
VTGVSEKIYKYISKTKRYSKYQILFRLLWPYLCCVSATSSKSVQMYICPKVLRVDFITIRGDDLTHRLSLTMLLLLEAARPNQEGE